jgi:exo-beta-1,3-glucanase (GH17 family)
MYQFSLSGCHDNQSLSQHAGNRKITVVHGFLKEIIENWTDISQFMANNAHPYHCQNIRKAASGHVFCYFLRRLRAICLNGIAVN